MEDKKYIVYENENNDIVVVDFPFDFESITDGHIANLIADILNKAIFYSTDPHLNTKEYIEKLVFDSETAGFKISAYLDFIDTVLLDKESTRMTTTAQRYHAYFMAYGESELINYTCTQSAEFPAKETGNDELDDMLARRNYDAIDFETALKILSDKHIPCVVSKTSRFDTFVHMFNYILLNMISKNEPLKKCENCGKYFYPSSRSDEKYCNNVFKNGKTCRQLGYEIKVSNDELLKTYRSAYKTANGWKNRNKNNVKDVDALFDNWHKSAKEKLRQAQNGDISIDDYKQWFKNNNFRNYAKRGVSNGE